MELKNKILEDMKVAMKERNALRLDTIRFLQASVKNKEIDLRPNPITEKDIIDVIKKLVNQRKDSIDQFTNAARMDLVEKETAELKILESYLPAQMSREQIEALVIETISELKVSSIKDMGALMKAVIVKTQGTADNKLVSEIIKSKLQ